MFALSPATRIFLRPGATDMRKSFNGLLALAQHQMQQDPLSGHLFVFCNRQRQRLKILFFDGSGIWVCAKRLEKGRFSWPESSAEKIAFAPEQLALLLGGIELEMTRAKAWFGR